MEPRFKTFQSGDSEYALLKSGATSSAPEYAASKDEWGVEFKTYPPGEKSFIPCPFCSGAPALTFQWSQWVGTNTSGGTTTIVIEIHCASCRTYSVFTREDVSYPYD